MSAYDLITHSWAVEALVWSSLFLALVIALRGPARHAFGARVAYLLWALPVLRLALPRIPGLEQGWRVEMDPARLIGVGPAMPPAAGEGLARLREMAAGLPVAAATPDRIGDVAGVTAPGLGIDWPATLLIVWLGGAALHLGWHLLAHRRFMRRIMADAVVLRRDCGIEIVTGPAVPGPLATGLTSRRILLPADFSDRYAPRERRLVLAHEVAHHVRGDLFANAAGLVFLSLNWFNPLAHWAWTLFRIDQELACDETVLAAEPRDARAPYGLAIVKSAAPRYPAAACAMHTAGQIKRRLRMMTRTRAGVGRCLSGLALGLAITAGGLALTASGTLAGAQPPVPPAPPAPSAPPAPTAARSVHHHVDRDGARLTVDGRRVDPASAEGRRVIAALPVPPVPPVAPMRTRNGAVIVNGHIVDRNSPEGRRAVQAAEEGLRAADEGLRAAEEGRRAAEEGRRIGDEARRAARIAAEEGRRAAEEGRRAGEEGRRAGEEARRAGARAAAAARASVAAMDVPGIVRASMASADRALAVACPAGKGCIDRMAILAEVDAAMVQARAEIAVERHLADTERRAALTEIDEARREIRARRY